MDFNQHASVFTAQGTEVGHLERVVIDPKTDEVTHLVVRKGYFLIEDKVLPINLIAAPPEDRIILRAGIQLDQLPDFEETHYVVANEKQSARSEVNTRRNAAPAMYWYPPYPLSPILPAWPPAEPPYEVETQINIPTGTVAVKAGAKVVARSGQPLGKVKRVFTSDQDERVTHVLIGQGLLSSEKKLIPVGWIKIWAEDELHLAVEPEVIDMLPNYNETTLTRPHATATSVERRKRKMAQGSKAKYTAKQKRQAAAIEAGYRKRGVAKDEAEKRAWATVNKIYGGGKKSGSGRGKAINTTPMKKGGRKGGAAAAARPAAARSASARKAARTRAANRASKTRNAKAR